MCPEEVLGSLPHGIHIQAAARSQVTGQEGVASQVGPTTLSHSRTPTLTLPAVPSIGFVQTLTAGQAGGSL